MFCTCGDAQRLALRFTPAFQAVHSPGLRSPGGGLVEVGAQQGPGQVLLRQEMLGVIVRVLIALAVPQGARIAVAILQVLRHAGDALLASISWKALK